MNSAAGLPGRSASFGEPPRAKLPNSPKWGAHLAFPEGIPTDGPAAVEADGLDNESEFGVSPDMEEWAKRLLSGHFWFASFRVLDHLIAPSRAMDVRWSAFAGSVSQRLEDVLHQQDEVQLVGR